MPRKPHNEANFPPLPFEEWDFREIAPDLVTLRVATIYEYLRSSPLRVIVEDWQSQEVGALDRVSLRLIAPALQNLGLVNAQRQFRSASDWWDRLEQLEADKGKVLSPRAYEKQYNRWFEAHLAEDAEQQTAFDAEPIAPCTVGDFINRTFCLWNDPQKIMWVLENLKRSLPDPIKKSGAAEFAVCFGSFPTAWLKLPSAYWEARRFLFAPEPWDPKDHEDPLRPVREIIHAVHDATLTGLHGSVAVRLAINLERTPDEIRDDFRCWLERYHTGLRPGRRNPEGWLQRLAAYRLTKTANMKAQEALELVQERRHTPAGHWPVLPTDSTSVRKWSEAVNRAEKDLKEGFVGKILRTFK